MVEPENLEEVEKEDSREDNTYVEETSKDMLSSDVEEESVKDFKDSKDIDIEEAVKEMEIEEAHRKVDL